jgi:hypothetical protein
MSTHDLTSRKLTPAVAASAANKKSRKRNNSRKGAKGTKETIDYKKSVLGVPSTVLRTCLAR